MGCKGILNKNSLKLYLHAFQKTTQFRASMPHSNTECGDASFLGNKNKATSSRKLEAQTHW